MPQVQVNEQIFDRAQRRAAEEGYSTVDEYVAVLLAQDLDLGESTENLDNFFTPARLAHIDAAEAEIKAGKFFTAEQADAELASRRAEWLRNNPR